MFVVTPSGFFFACLSNDASQVLSLRSNWLHSRYGYSMVLKRRNHPSSYLLFSRYTYTHSLSLLRSCAVYASVANIWGCLNPKPFWPQENAAVLSTVYPNYLCTLKVSAAALKVLPFCVSVFFSSCFFCGCCPPSHFFLLLIFSLVFLFVLSLFSSWVFLGLLGFLLS